MNNYLMTLAFCFFSTLGLNAQITATASENASDEVREARVSKRALERRLDVFNTRNFKPFLYAETNYGLFGSFSRDEAYTIAAPVSLGLGVRLSPTWSVGLRVGQSVYNCDAYYYDRTYETRIQTRLKVANLLVNTHFPIGLRGEAYGGFSLGYQDTDITALEEGPKDGSDRRVVRPQKGLLYTGQIGVRYSITPTLSVQSELTSGLSNFNVGVRLRLR